MKPTWIVQSNLRNSVTLGMLSNACERLDLELMPVSILPGAEMLPTDLPNGPLIAHGATTLVKLAVRDRRFLHGVFYIPENFCHSAYLRGYGRDYVNADAVLVSWEEALERLAENREQFVKPPDDLKAFTGFVATRSKLKTLHEKVLSSSLPCPDTILIGPLHEVDAEWRLFVIEGAIVSGSMYLPSAESHLPVDLLEFAGRAIERWAPAPVFVIDIGRVNGEWRIIECNCFNWSRFYMSNVDAIVRALSHYQITRWASGT